LFETEKDYIHHISTIPINQIGFIDAHSVDHGFAAKKYCKRSLTTSPLPLGVSLLQTKHS
jgi:hypothetical protein